MAYPSNNITNVQAIIGTQRLVKTFGSIQLCTLDILIKMLKRYKKCSESFNHKVVKNICHCWRPAFDDDISSSYCVLVLHRPEILRTEMLIHCICPFVKDITLKDCFFMWIFQCQKDITVSLKIPRQMSLTDLFWSSQGFGFICLFFIVLFSRHLFNKLWLHFTGGNCSFWKRSKKLFVLFQLWSWSSVTLSPLVEIHTKQAFW